MHAKKQCRTWSPGLGRGFQVAAPTITTWRCPSSPTRKKEEGLPVQMVWSRKTRMSKALVSSLEPGQHKDKLRQTRTSILRPCCTGVHRLVPCWRSRAWLSIVENQPQPQPFRKCSCRMSSFVFLWFHDGLGEGNRKKKLVWRIGIAGAGAALGHAGLEFFACTAAHIPMQNHRGVVKCNCDQSPRATRVRWPGPRMFSGVPKTGGGCLLAVGGINHVLHTCPRVGNDLPKQCVVAWLG